MVLCYRCDDEIGDDPLEKLNPPGRNGSVANRGRRTLLPLVLAIDSGRDQGEGRCATSCCKDRSVGVLTVRNEILRDTLAVLAAAGIKPVVTHGAHIEVQWRDASGHKHTLVVSSSTRSRSALKANRTILRRLLRS